MVDMATQQTNVESRARGIGIVWQQRVVKGLIYFSLAALSVLFLMPLVWMFLTSSC